MGQLTGQTRTRCAVTHPVPLTGPERQEALAPQQGVRNSYCKSLKAIDMGAEEP